MVIAFNKKVFSKARAISIIWSPLLSKHISRIKRIQRKKSKDFVKTYQNDGVYHADNPVETEKHYWVVRVVNKSKVQFIN